MTRQPAPLAFSTVFGVLMAVAAAGPRPVGLVAAALALLAVGVGVVYRPASAVAVAAAAVALALSDPPVLSAALCGLSAAVYLVIRHAAGTEVVTTTGPTVLGMLGFTGAAVLAGFGPWQLAWVSLLAPAAVVAIMVAVMATMGAGLFREDPVRYE